LQIRVWILGTYLMPSLLHETALVTAGGGLMLTSNLYPSWL
jgi:hypothetical protein